MKQDQKVMREKDICHKIAIVQISIFKHSTAWGLSVIYHDEWMNGHQGTGINKKIDKFFDFMKHFVQSWQVLGPWLDTDKLTRRESFYGLPFPFH